jgi:hypothetical protein
MVCSRPWTVIRGIGKICDVDLGSVLQAVVRRPVRYAKSDLQHVETLQVSEFVHFCLATKQPVLNIQGLTIKLLD